jgi:hypothetical protein
MITIPVWQLLTLMASVTILMACLQDLMSRTLTTHYWFSMFMGLVTSLRTGGHVDPKELADVLEQISWKMIEDDRKRTFYGRRWLRTYKAERLHEEAERIARGGS